MTFLKFFAYTWFFFMLLTLVGILVGYYVENKVDDNKPLKKWWRKHIVGEDSGEEHFWKNFNK